MASEGGVTAELLDLVERMLVESGRPGAEGFDARAWLGRWLAEPLPAFRGATPASFLTTPEGREEVKTMLLRMQSGAYT